MINYTIYLRQNLSLQDNGTNSHQSVIRNHAQAKYMLLII